MPEPERTLRVAAMVEVLLERTAFGARFGQFSHGLTPASLAGAVHLAAISNLGRFGWPAGGSDYAENGFETSSRRDQILTPVHALLAPFQAEWLQGDLLAFRSSIALAADGSFRQGMLPIGGRLRDMGPLWGPTLPTSLQMVIAGMASSPLVSIGQGIVDAGPPSAHFLHGLHQVAQHLVDHVPLQAGTWAEALQNAHAIVNQFELDATAYRQQLLGVDLFQHIPASLQSAVGSISFGTNDRYFFVQDPTGGGPEAAVVLALILLQQKKVDGLILAAPTRSSAYVAHRRLDALLARIFPQPPSTLFAIGGNHFNQQPSHVLEWYRRYCPDGSNRARVRTVTTGPRSFIVGTDPKVGLRDCYKNGSQNNLGLVGASRLATIILYPEGRDEDDRRSDYLQRSCEWLQLFHGPVIAVDDWLSQSPRNLIEQHVPALSPASFPVCSVTVVDNAYTTHTYQGSAPPRQVNLQVLDLMEHSNQVADMALRRAQAGHTVLVLCNVFAAGQDRFDATETAHQGPLLFRVNGASTWFHRYYLSEDSQCLLDAMQQRLSDGTPGVIVSTAGIVNGVPLQADVVIADIASAAAVNYAIFRANQEAIILAPNDFAFDRGLLGGIRGTGLGVSPYAVYPNIVEVRAVCEFLRRHPSYDHSAASQLLHTTHYSQLHGIASQYGTDWVEALRRVEGMGSARRQERLNDAIDPRSYPSNQFGILPPGQGPKVDDTQEGTTLFQYDDSHQGQTPFGRDLRGQSGEVKGVNLGRAVTITSRDVVQNQDGSHVAHGVPYTRTGYVPNFQRRR